MPGDAEKWGDQVKDNLEPIGSSSNVLVAISELLIPIHFPNADAQVLKLQKATVEAALEELCSAYEKEGCTTNPKDRLDIPPRTAVTGRCLQTLTGHTN